MNHIFPKWFFHQDLLPDGKIIRSQEQFEELGEGWVTSPNDFVDQPDANEETESVDLGMPKKRGRKSKVNP